MKYGRNSEGYSDPTANEAIANLSQKQHNDIYSVQGVFRGDIYIVANKNNAYGHEQRNSRPAVVVSNDKNNKFSTTVEVVYLTTKPKHSLPTHVQVIGRMLSTALCEQITTIDKRRLGDFVRTCSDKEMREIDKALAISLGLKKKEEVLFYDN